MKIKEIMSLIEKTDQQIKNLQKFNLLSPEEKKEIEEKVGLNSPLENMVDLSVHVMASWKAILQEKIEESELDSKFPW